MKFIGSIVSGVKDMATSIAVRNLDERIRELSDHIAALEAKQTYVRTATVVASRTLAANASATAANNNSVLAALILDLQALDLIS